MSEQVNVQKRIIAVPSKAPGGLKAQRSGHFGHCEFFTLVEVGDGVIGNVSVVDNAPHREGRCLAPVDLLASLGATEIVVSGLGARPLAFFEEKGITVYVDQHLSTVEDVVNAHLQGAVPVMSGMQVCGGGGGGCH